MLVSEILDESRSVWLNDASATLYDNDVLLPFIKSAYSDLLSALELNNLQQLAEVSTTIPLTAGNTSLTLPADFVAPIRVEERKTGSSDHFREVSKVRSIPDEDKTDSLNYWELREDGINFLGATVNIDVRLTYTKSLSITGESTPIPIIGAENYLAPRTAELAAMSIGQNPTIAQYCGANAIQAIDELIRKSIKQGQANPVRRKPYQFNLKG